MDNIVIDLNYAKKQRESILSNEECNTNTNSQLEIFSVPMKYIIDFHLNLGFFILNLNEDFSDKYVREVLLEDLISILNKMSDISIFLDMDLISEIPKKETEVDDLEIILNSLFNHVSMLNLKKETARLKIRSRIIPLFAQLVYSSGFSLEELKEYYNKQNSEDAYELKA